MGGGGSSSNRQPRLRLHTSDDVFSNDYSEERDPPHASRQTMEQQAAQQGTPMTPNRRHLYTPLSQQQPYPGSPRGNLGIGHASPMQPAVSPLMVRSASRAVSSAHGLSSPFGTPSGHHQPYSSQHPTPTGPGHGQNLAVQYQPSSPWRDNNGQVMMLNTTKPSFRDNGQPQQQSQQPAGMEGDNVKSVMPDIGYEMDYGRGRTVSIAGPESDPSTNGYDGRLYL